MGMSPQVITPVRASKRIDGQNIEIIRVVSDTTTVETTVEKGPVTNSPFHEEVTMQLNQLKSGIDDHLSLEVVNIDDSRCPIDVACIWEGMVRVEIRTSLDGGAPQKVSVSDKEAMITVPGSKYTIRLLSVLPFPKLQDGAGDADKMVVLVVNRT